MRRGPGRPPRQLGVGGGSIGAREKEYVLDALERGRLSYGDYSRQFEAEFARLHDRRYAIFCNSGTSALQVALHALKKRHGWRDGDEVIVPAQTFVATVNVVIQNGLTPVFVDVDPVHFHIDPELIEDAIGPRTQAIIPVHLIGQPADMDPILDVAGRHHLEIVEDSCEAVFVKYKGHPVGTFGSIACFSTYMAHVITTGVGGMALTDDPALAVDLKSLINHGRDGIYTSMDDDQTEDAGRLRQVVGGRFRFLDVGYSYRATELEAAIGVAQLERWEQILRAHQTNAQTLLEGLQPVADRLQLPSVRPGCEHAFMMFPLVLLDERQSRETLVLELEKRMVETRHLLPLLNQPVYRRLFGDLEREYPVAARLNRCGFYVGCHPELSGDDLGYMVESIIECVGG